MAGEFMGRSEWKQVRVLGSGCGPRPGVSAVPPLRSHSSQVGAGRVCAGVRLVSEGKGVSLGGARGCVE